MQKTQNIHFRLKLQKEQPKNRFISFIEKTSLTPPWLEEFLTWFFKILIKSPGFPGSPGLSEPCHSIVKLLTFWIIITSFLSKKHLQRIHIDVDAIWRWENNHFKFGKSMILYQHFLLLNQIKAFAQQWEG